MKAILPIFFLLFVPASARPSAGRQDKPRNRSYFESLLLVKKEALAWNKEAQLLKVAYTSELLFDIDPRSDQVSDLEFQFCTRDGCAPGEMKIRTWTLKSNDTIAAAGEEKTERNGFIPLPEKLIPVKTAADLFRAQGMKWRPKMEASVIHGRPLWHTTNGPKTPPGLEYYFADAVTGEFVSYIQATIAVLQYIRDQTSALTTWKQAVDAIEKDLKAWKLSEPQVSTIRAQGRSRRYLDRELGITEWEFQIYVDKPAPAMLFYRVSNGNVAYWAQDSVPSDKSHLTPLSSWSLAGAGDKVLAHAAVKPFLESLPNVSTQLQVDAAHMKTGEAIFKITNVQNRSTLEVTLDKKGGVKGAAKK